MRPSQHVLLSGIVFSIAYALGVNAELIIIAFLASILIDIDHLLVGRVIGSYNPNVVYDYCINRKFLERMTWQEIAIGKLFGNWFFPLHNIWVTGTLLWLWLPAGVGMIFHSILDFYQLFFDAPGKFKGA